MPIHDIELAVPAQAVKNADAEIKVWSDGKLLGRMQISKGSIDWHPGKSPTTYRMEWERFAELMRAEGHKL